MKFLVLVLAALLAGCATTRAPAYRDPLAPPMRSTDYATLRTEGGSARGLMAGLQPNTYLLEIDDRELGACTGFFQSLGGPNVCLPQEAYLLPGRHKIWLRWQQNDRLQSAQLDLAVEARATYQVRHEVVGRTGRFWVEKNDRPLAEPVAVWSPVRTKGPATGVRPAQRELALPLRAFQDLCLEQAPTFAGSVAAAAAFGITGFQDFSVFKLGQDPATGLSVQVAPGKECTVTAPAQPGPQLHDDLILMLEVAKDRNRSGYPIPTVVIDGVTYFIRHDRDGGETLVMRRM